MKAKTMLIAAVLSMLLSAVIWTDISHVMDASATSLVEFTLYTMAGIYFCNWLFDCVRLVKKCWINHMYDMRRESSKLALRYRMFVEFGINITRLEEDHIDKDDPIWRLVDDVNWEQKYDLFEPYWRSKYIGPYSKERFARTDALVAKAYQLCGVPVPQTC